MMTFLPSFLPISSSVSPYQWLFRVCRPHCRLVQNPQSAKQKVGAEIPLAPSAKSLISSAASFSP